MKHLSTTARIVLLLLIAVVLFIVTLFQGEIRSSLTPVGTTSVVTSLPFTTTSTRLCDIGLRAYFLGNEVIEIVANPVGLDGGACSVAKKVFIGSNPLIPETLTASLAVTGGVPLGAGTVVDGNRLQVRGAKPGQQYFFRAVLLDATGKATISAFEFTDVRIPVLDTSPPKSVSSIVTSSQSGIPVYASDTLVPPVSDMALLPIAGGVELRFVYGQTVVPDFYAVYWKFTNDEREPVKAYYTVRHDPFRALYAERIMIARNEPVHIGIAAVKNGRSSPILFKSAQPLPAPAPVTPSPTVPAPTPKPPEPVINVGYEFTRPVVEDCTFVSDVNPGLTLLSPTNLVIRGTFLSKTLAEGRQLIMRLYASDGTFVSQCGGMSTRSEYSCSIMTPPVSKDMSLRAAGFITSNTADRLAGQPYIYGRCGTTNETLHAVTMVTPKEQLSVNVDGIRGKSGVGALPRTFWEGPVTFTGTVLSEMRVESCRLLYQNAVIATYASDLCAGAKTGAQFPVPPFWAQKSGLYTMTFEVQDILGRIARQVFSFTMDTFPLTIAISDVPSESSTPVTPRVTCTPSGSTCHTLHYATTFNDVSSCSTVPQEAWVPCTMSGNPASCTLPTVEASGNLGKTLHVCAMGRNTAGKESLAQLRKTTFVASSAPVIPDTSPSEDVGQYVSIGNATIVPASRALQWDITVLTPFQGRYSIVNLGTLEEELYSRSFSVGSTSLTSQMVPIRHGARYVLRLYVDRPSSVLTRVSQPYQVDLPITPELDQTELILFDLPDDVTEGANVTITLQRGARSFVLSNVIATKRISLRSLITMLWERQIIAYPKIPIGSYTLTITLSNGRAFSLPFLLRPYYFDTDGDLNGDGVSHDLVDTLLLKNAARANRYQSESERRIQTDLTKRMYLYGKSWFREFITKLGNS